MVRLYLFTTAFPFGRGENFLEQELPYLARHFDHVTVLPTRRVDAVAGRREVPSNVDLDMTLAVADDDLPMHVELSFRLRSALAEAADRPRTVLSRNDLRRLWFYLRMAARARRWVRAKRLDAGPERAILYTYWLDGTTFGLGAGRGPRTTLVSRVHNGDLYEEKHPSGYLPLYRAAVERVDALFPVSDHGRRYLVSRWPEHAGRIAVVRLGVPDPEHVTPASTDGVFRIVTCSHINPVKRIPLIIDGVAAFAADHPAVTVLWQHLGDGPAREALAEQARATLPANASADFVGRLPPGGVIHHYRTHAVDAFLNASSAEGVPVSIMEAQSCGIPVVATRVGGTPEIVNDQNGVVLPADPTPHDIADALAAVRQDDGSRRVASRETWRQHSRAESVYPAFAARIERIRHPSG